MKRLFKLSLLLLALLLPVTALAHDFEVDGIYFNINGNDATVTYKETDNYSNCTYSGNVTIPAKVTYNSTTFSVTCIGSYAFADCSNLTSIEIPNSVTSIGDYAFSGCSNLTSITIPNSVTYISSYAFFGCSNLTSVTIPNSVTSIDNYAFDSCSGLTSIEIPNSVTSIGSGAFICCFALTNIEIPNSVTSIGNEAFDCTPWYENQPDGLLYAGLVAYKYKGTMPNGTRIILRDGTLAIADRAFYDCSNLTSITIPNSVTSIGDEAFSGCTGLNSIEIPNSVTYIGDEAFDHTPWYENQPDGLLYAGLVAYKYKGTMPSGTRIILRDGTLAIADRAFYDCSNLTSITIPNSVTSIGDEAFWHCYGLTSITIPNSVTYIGKHAFIGNNLTSISVESGNPCYDSRGNCNAIIETATNTLITGCINTVIPNSVTSIGEIAFYGCSNLTTIEIPNSVTSIGSSAFAICSNLTSIEIPNSVTSIGDYAFSGCSNLTSITIPNSVIYIGYCSFNNCTSLTNITIPNSVIHIGGQAFGYCRLLTSIEIPNSVISIRNSTFTRCSGLTSITIPNSVTYIGSGAFHSCSNLTTVEIPNSVTSIDDNAFCGCSNLTSITIPNSVTYIGYSSFNNCTSLTSITIPNSVTSIRDKAFYQCRSLKNVYSYIENLSLVAMSSSVFALNPANFSIRTLYVPVGSLEAYQADTKWSQYFGSIVEMEPVLATSVELDCENVELMEGETLQLTTTVLPDDATDKTVTWASSDETIATVDENGLVTAIASGTATITATTVDGSDLSASCVINVTDSVTTPTVENQFIVSDISAKHGDVVVIPISLINNQTFAAFQTDVFLPEGFSIVTDEDDEYIITPSERLTSDHVLMTNNANNGSIRILCYTPNALPISGNEGELFYITIQVPNNAEGLYTITLRNSLMTTTEYQEIGIPDAEGQMEIYSFIPGDVNDSRTVTVTDIVVTAQHVLDMNPSPFIFEAADMNSDGNVTVTDIMLIAYLINHPTMNAPRRMPSLMNVGDRMSSEDVTLMAGENRTVNIFLDNATDYTAFQLDLTLPEGLTASNFQLTDRACSHALDVNTLSNGKTRVLCYSPAIETISGHNGVLLAFDVTSMGNVKGSITVDGIEMVTADCQTALLDDFSIDVNTATSVNDIPGAKAVLRMNYFNLAGQQIDRPDSGVTLVVTTYTDGTRTTTKVMK